MTQATHNDRILPLTRWVAALVIPFLVVAFIILYLFPSDTGRLFAWGIQPTMSARMLGAAYAGGVWFFFHVLRGRQWHRVHVGFMPVITFASLLGIATLLHWDRFTHNHVSFVAWAGLYFTTPFLVCATWLRNRREDSDQAGSGGATLPSTVRLALGAAGALTLVISLGLFLALPGMIGLWPWTLSPLTARVMGALFALPGVVGLGIAMDARWSAARIILQAQGFSILLILLAVLLGWGEFDRAKPAAWLFIGGLVALLAGITLLYGVYERRLDG